MPRDSSGNYTLPLGNPVVDGTIIDVNWANPTMADIAVQLNNVLTRDGLLGPVVPFYLVDGTSALPGLAFGSAHGTGLWRDTTRIGLSYAGTLKQTWGATTTNFGIVDLVLSDSKEIKWGDGQTSVFGTGGATPRLTVSTKLLERFRVGPDGHISFGPTQSSIQNVRSSKSITGATTAHNFAAASTVASDVTVQSSGYLSATTTEANAFTLATLSHFLVSPANKGAGSAITDAIGFHVNSTLGVQGVNNFGFKGEITVGAGTNWNLYMSGTAPNFFSGKLLTGTPTAVTNHIAATVANAGVQQNSTNFDATVLALNRFFVGTTVGPGIVMGKARTATVGDYTGINNANDTLGSIDFNGVDGTEMRSAVRILGRQLAGTVTGVVPGYLEIHTTAVGAAPQVPVLRMHLSDAGLITSVPIVGHTPAAAPTLSTNSQMVFSLTSNTNLRVSVRGTDGVTRVANMTLA